MKVLVTGASGFIGGRFVRHALQQGLAVRATGRRWQSLEPLARCGAECVEGDLANPAFAESLCEDVEAVVHCAGAVGVWGRHEDFRRGNLLLTENVIEACLKRRVRRLVHLSSPSIYFDGHDHLGLREEQVPRRFASHYARTKFLAEQRLFGAQAFGLEVLALRPRFVTGAGDLSIFPRMIALQQSKRLAIVGKGLNRVDFTSVHNLNQALISALRVGEPALGRAYNISNGAPVPLWDAVNYVLRRLQLPQVTRHVPVGLAQGLATLNEGLCLLWPGRPEPALSRLKVAVLSRDFTLDIGLARQHLDYQPTTSLWTALDEFCHWWQAQA